MLPPIGKSDHCALTYKMIGSPTQVKRDKIRMNYYKGDYDTMRNELNMNWSEYFQTKSVEESWEMLKNKLQELCDRYIPKIQSGRKLTKPIWMNETALRKVKKKYAAWRRFIESD